MITGAGGRTGSFLARFLKERGHEIIEWTRRQTDFSRQEALEEMLLAWKEAEPGAVINCAAVSSLEACLDDPVTAHEVNAMMPEALARFCEREEVRLIHFSTDYVLDGRRPGKKAEDARCKPINVYGESKYEAEIRIRENNPSAVIARVSWIFGNPAKPSFPEAFIQKALAGVPLEAVEDKFSLPASLSTISHAVNLFLENRQTAGIYHVCDSGDPVSWRDYAQASIDAAFTLGLPLKTSKVQGISMASLPAFRDPRPPHTAMDNTKLASLAGSPLPDWHDSLFAYLKSICRDKSLNLD